MSSGGLRLVENQQDNFDATEILLSKLASVPFLK